MAAADSPDMKAMIARVFEPPPANNNIKVAVRIRPPNQRELANSAGSGNKSIVTAREDVVRVEGSKEKNNKLAAAAAFSFDHALGESTSNVELFSALGVPVVQNAYHGYNTTLFAYGQTSSGKSYSMVGRIPDKMEPGQELDPSAGIIPRVANLLFGAANAVPETHEFRVEVAFVEIYNEQVRDLLDPSDTDLKVRESPKLGVHITGLTTREVTSESAVGRELKAGFRNRTVSSTRYNAESSRSHAIFRMNILQKYLHVESGEKMQSQSTVNLVDLAGSERSDMVGSKGVQLKEGSNINKSLTVLGRCIKALVDIAKNPALAAKVKKSTIAAAPPSRKGLKAKKVARKKAGERTSSSAAGTKGGMVGGIVVPFRESILTWYLRESLSGNARTTMLAAVSPVALNREETLSTLRYAASAKNIKTVAEKREDPMEVKIRQLSEEISRLKEALEAAAASPNGGGGAGGAGGGGAGGGALADMNDEERVEYLAALSAEMDFDLGNRSSRFSRQSSSFDGSSAAGGSSSFPQLTCLNKDEMLNHAMTIPIAPEAPGEVFTIGCEGGQRHNDFVLNGVGMHQRHCEVVDRGPGGMFIHSDGRGPIVLVNGTPLEELNSADGPSTCKLSHLDRITLGPCRMLTMFLTEPLSLPEKLKWTYDACFEELMHRESLQWSLLGTKRRRLLDTLKEAEILYVEQANAIAIDMCTCIRFSATIILGGGGLLPLLRGAESSLDDVLDGSDTDVVIVCQVNTNHLLDQKTTAEQASAGATKEEEEEGGAIAAANGDGDGDGAGAPTAAAAAEEEAAPAGIMRMSLMESEEEDLLSDGLGADDFESSPVRRPSSSIIEDLNGNNNGGGGGGGGGGEGEDGDILDQLSSSRRKSMFETLSRTDNLTLFEMKMSQFQDLLAELKITYSYVASLSQGLGGSEELEADGGDTAGVDEKSGTVQAIFDTVDCDNSGTIDRSELAAAFKLFDESAIDPTFCDRMMHDLLPEDQSTLDCNQFSIFLVQFLQHQFLHKLEPYISNQSLFITLGGRDLAAVIEEERKKEVALEYSNAQLEHNLRQAELALKKKTATKGKTAKKGDGDGDDDGDDGDDGDGDSGGSDEESQMMDEASGQEGVVRFLTKAGLAPFGPVLLEMGVDSIADLLDAELVGEDELDEAGMSKPAQQDQFYAAVASFREKSERRAKKEKKRAAKAQEEPKHALAGSIHEDFDPTAVSLEALTRVPVIIMNARSHRKLFAQAGKRPTIFETWAKGFGAGPEEHTFKDNKWWLVPQKNAAAAAGELPQQQFVIVNAHSSRKLYAKRLKSGAKWDKEVGAVAAEDTSPENAWLVVQQADGSFDVQNAVSKRRLYARVPKKDGAWTSGVGACPADHRGSDASWYIIPDPMSLGGSAKFQHQPSMVVTHTEKDSPLGGLRRPSLTPVSFGGMVPRGKSSFGL